MPRALPSDKYYAGTYAGIAVHVSPNYIGTLEVVTRDPRARDHGFDNLDRTEYIKIVALDDPALKVWEVPRGTPLPPAP